MTTSARGVTSVDEGGTAVCCTVPVQSNHQFLHDHT